jgi:diguanylate cyclase (GGDEF)-like protein
MPISLPSQAAHRLERFLAHGTAHASHEDALVIRRARGFSLIGLTVVILMALVASTSHEPLQVLIATVVLLSFMLGGIALGFVKGARWIRPVTHAGMGAMLAGIFASSVQVGEGNDTTATFPILLILVTSYVLGVKAAVFWTLASIVGAGFAIHISELSALALEGSVTTKPGLFATRAIVFLGVLALAVVERRFADRKSAQLEFLARHDGLTGLYNRRAFDERVCESIARAARHDRCVAFLVLDLDNFKSVNDNHGHAAGDEVLRSIGRRIASLTRSTDSACRMGGDEFLVHLEDVIDEKNVKFYAERIVASIREPVFSNSEMLHVGASAGVALSPEACEIDAGQLARAADVAMYSAKQAGGNRVHVYDPSVLGDGKD